jgi:hypothetical protein
MKIGLGPTAADFFVARRRLTKKSDRLPDRLDESGIKKTDHLGK